MKKIISIVAVVAMVLSMTVSAFADAPSISDIAGRVKPDEVNVNIKCQEFGTGNNKELDGSAMLKKFEANREYDVAQLAKDYPIDGYDFYYAVCQMNGNDPDFGAGMVNIKSIKAVSNKEIICVTDGGKELMLSDSKSIIFFYTPAEKVPEWNVSYYVYNQPIEEAHIPHNGDYTALNTSGTTVSQTVLDEVNWGIDCGDTKYEVAVDTVELNNLKGSQELTAAYLQEKPAMRGYTVVPVRFVKAGNNDYHIDCKIVRDDVELDKNTVLYYVYNTPNPNGHIAHSTGGFTDLKLSVTLEDTEELKTLFAEMNQSACADGKHEADMGKAADVLKDVEPANEELVKAYKAIKSDFNEKDLAIVPYRFVSEGEKVFHVDCIVVGNVTEPPTTGGGIDTPEPPTTGGGIDTPEPPTTGGGIDTPEPPTTGGGIDTPEPPTTGGGIDTPEPPTTGGGIDTPEPPTTGGGIDTPEPPTTGGGIDTPEPPTGGGDVTNPDNGNGNGGGGSNRPGNGGNSGGNNDVNINDENVPMGSGEEVNTPTEDAIIEDEETPLAEAPAEEAVVEIGDEEVPMGMLPQTGGAGIEIFAGLGSLLLLLGALCRRKENR